MRSGISAAVDPAKGGGKGMDKLACPRDTSRGSAVISGYRCSHESRLRAITTAFRRLMMSVSAVAANTECPLLLHAMRANSGAS